VKPTVLLISPGILRWTDQDFGLPHLVSIGGWLEAHCGVKVAILDLGYEACDRRALARTIEGLGPLLLIGLSCYSSFDYRRVLSVGHFLKELRPGVPLVTGGYHASALPGDLLFDGSPFDAVVQGEGEKPLAAIVQGLLGGAPIERKVWPSDLIADLDTLPPTRWDLLDRYWPRAKDIGRKLQIYMSRGCPYHCTFCMERSKSGYQWRAHSPGRALEELRRLSRKTDLSHWVINVADPLFGFQRAWRREVLEGVIREELFPRQFWTLTRSDDLDDLDVSLLARARFSIGIGMESGSPRMLKIMQKGNAPAAYLDALLRLSGLARTHGLSWAANVIVGHPGEDQASMRETRAFLEELYLSAPDTCGWVSIDPFRLYPGADVHERLPTWEREHGAHFYDTEWWKRWYDGAFGAQHIDPSATLSYEDRVRYMYEAYPPLVAEVQRRFRGQGRSIDRVFERSLSEQTELLSVATRDRLLAQAARANARRTSSGRQDPDIHVPIGLQIRDPWVRKREEAVRRLLESGVLRTERVIEAMLEIAPEQYMPDEVAEAALLDRPIAPLREGEAPWAVGVTALVLGLEALALGPGDRAVDLQARSGWVSVLLARLVGAGEVVAIRPGAPRVSEVWAPNVRVIHRGGAGLLSGLSTLEAGFDGAWLGAAVPRAPRGLLDVLRGDGRAVLALGPRFRPQDLTLVVRHAADAAPWLAGAPVPPGGGTEPEPEAPRLVEHRLARVQFGVFGGPGGWVPAPPSPEDTAEVSVVRWEGPARAFAVFARLDLGADAASCHDARLPTPAWAPALAAAWSAAPGRLALVAEVMRYPTVDALVQALAQPPEALRDPAGRALCEGFAAALAMVEDTPERAAPGIDQRILCLRRLLFAAAPTPPPPLVVLDCPALGPRGRATTFEGLRRVAVSLDEPADFVVMQVLHEEMHVVTDPHVLGEHAGATRDTRVGTEGWALHAALEEMAILATHALLSAKAPEELPAFQAWCTRMGVAL
jgi:radical SAM superfamily enzyme YgiQ (UPF0313 family)/protein-L-isoaspartate O-methyltransferase